MALGGSNRVRVPERSAEPSSCLHALSARHQDAHATPDLPLKVYKAAQPLTQWHSGPSGGPSPEVQHLTSAGGACDRLVLEVPHEALRAEFAAYAAGLVPAEGRAALDHVHIDAIGAS